MKRGHVLKSIAMCVGALASACGDSRNEPGTAQTERAATVAPTLPATAPADAGSSPSNPGPSLVEHAPVTPMPATSDLDNLSAVLADYEGIAIVRFTALPSRFENNSTEPEDIVTDFQVQVVETLAGQLPALITV